MSTAVEEMTANPEPIVTPGKPVEIIRSKTGGWKIREGKRPKKKPYKGDDYHHKMMASHEEALAYIEAHPGVSKDDGTPTEPAEKASDRIHPADITEGLTMITDSIAEVVEDRIDPGVGRALSLTSITSARLIAQGVSKYKGLHAFLAIFLGPGKQELAACLAVPYYVHAMEEDPDCIPKVLPKLRRSMVPVLRDWIAQQRKEEEVEAELAELAGLFGGLSVNEVILQQLLGLSSAECAAILAGAKPSEVIASE